MKYLFVLLGYIFGCAYLAEAQPFQGFPNIHNYTSEEYNGSVQNWGFAEDSNGVLYASNLQSILRFDGVEWQYLNVPNGRTYGIHATEKGTIYVGGINEFGYLGKPDNENTYTSQYYSLRHLVPDSISIDRIFEITSVADTVYFQSNNLLIRYDGEHLKLFFPDSRFSSLFKIDNGVYVRDAAAGLIQVHSDTIKTAIEDPFFAENTLFGFLNTTNGKLFCSYFECRKQEEGNLESIQFEVNEYLAEHYLDEAIVLSDGTLAFATRAGGIVHTDVNGNILTIFNEENGLINNTVYGIYEDRNGSIWAATVGGISRIDYTLPLRFFDSRAGITEAVYDINYLSDGLILGTTTGIYHQNGQQLTKYSVNETCFQVFPIQSKVYAACGQKIYYYQDGNYETIEGIFGHKFGMLREPDIVVMANEYQLTVVELNEGESKVLYETEELSVIPVSIEVDEEENIWISHRNGVSKIVFSWENGKITGHKINHYLTNIENIADDHRVEVSSINEHLHFLTWGKGILNYDEQSDQMIKNESFGTFFSDTTKQYFFAEEDQTGNIWFRSDSDYQALIKQENGHYQLYEGPFKLIDHRQNNVIYPHDPNYVWYGTNQGLVRFTKNHSFNHRLPFHTEIKEVLVRNDSLVNGGSASQNPILNYNDNELRFTFAGASYFVDNVYRVKLEGFESEWTDWSIETQKDYTNIPEGDYEFKVQARNIFGVVSESAGFSFSILPPWYRTWWAYLLYSLTIVGILYTAYKIRVNQLLRVERIRNSIASDLHDEVSATLSSISYFAQAIDSDKVKGDKSRFLKLISNSAGDAKEKITDIVWAINPEHDDWTGFLSKCRRYASDLLESKDINYSLKIDEFIPGKLDMQLRQHLWLIFKEMVTNAARHSQARNVDVIMKYEQGYFKLVVQDDGQGMDVDGVRKGNGLVNINKRADQLGAEVNLRTSQGFGTRWMLKVKI